MEAIAKIAALAAVLCFGVVAAQPPVVEMEPENYFGSPPTLDTLEELRESGQWTTEAKTVLAQALWGEAGIRGHYSRTVPRNPRLRGHVVSCDDERAGPECFSNNDWKLIPWVMLKRWEDVRARGSRISFASLVRAYSSALRPELASDERLRRARRTSNDSEIGQIMRRRFLQSLRFDGSNLDRSRRQFGRRASAELYREGWSEITSLVDEWGQGRIENPCEDARHWDSRGADVARMVPVCLDLETLNVFYAVPLRRPEPEDT